MNRRSFAFLPAPALALALVLAFTLTVTLVAPNAAASPAVVGFDRFHAHQADANGGRLLYNELGCINCHGGTTGLPPRRGPDLAGITLRARTEWLQAFLASPDTARPGTAMPHVFAQRDPADIEAAVHFLSSVGPRNAPRARLIRHVNAASGKELFHTRGCVACHAPQSDYTPPDGTSPAAELRATSAALPDLRAKYTLATLAEIIRDPLKSRPDGRMPRTELEEQDVVDIAAYLLGIAGSDGENTSKLAPFVTQPALVARGRQVVTELRCASCHAIPSIAAPPPTPLARAEAGCLSEAPAPGRPHYALSAVQRQALQAFLAQRDAPLPPASRVALTLQALNCVACHERDGHGGPEAARKSYFAGDHNLGDTGRYPPPLTGVGRKLQPTWLEQALQGKARVRPYLQAKMPLYGAAVAELPALLAEVDGSAPGTLPPGDIEAGRKLLGTNGGVSCITCHSWSDRASLGIHALDISNLAARLQPGWLRDYLVDPAAHRPGTLMPSFWPGGKAANATILDGDTDRQIASILAFARDGKGRPEGFPSVTAREFELKPTDRPIVLRTFMKDVGTHAILVGFPAGVHLAYDGKAARPALLWRGPFFDAYGTWFSRFAPFEQPLGNAFNWPAPARATNTAEPRFTGYRLDAAGVPTFLVTLDGVNAEERFEATATSLRRTVRWNVEQRREFPVAHPDGVTLTEETGSAPGQRVFIYTWP